MPSPSRMPTALEAVWSNVALRRTLVAYAMVSLVEFGSWVAIILYAYAKGGVTLAGLVSVAQLLPAAFLAPAFTSILDRLPRGPALTVARASIAAALIATVAVLLVDAPVPIVVVMSALSTIAVCAARPLHFAALPRLARGPEDLVSANAFSSVGEGFAMTAGPLLAGIGVQMSGAWLVFAWLSVVATVATLIGLGTHAGPAPAMSGHGESEWRVAVNGLATLWRDFAAMALLLVLATRFVTGGALDVLGVAYSEQVLDIGASGAGLVIGAFGFGWLIGGGLASSTALRIKLAPVIATSGAVQGGAFAGVSLFVVMSPAVVSLVVVGLASAVMTVSGRTLLQRSTDDAVLARVFAVQEGISLIGWAFGAAVARVLVEQWGPSDAFVPLGVGVVLFTLASYVLMRHLDARSVRMPEETALLRMVDFLASLPPFELERLAHSARWMNVVPGEEVIRQGDVGDRFYVVDSGELSVSIDGFTKPERLTQGMGFGEIALLRSVPRTATVTALTECRLLVVAAADFLAAVTDSPDGWIAAEEPSREL
jgi:MFS family permease